MKRSKFLLVILILFFFITRVSFTKEQFTLMAVGDVNPEVLSNYSNEELKELANTFSKADIVTGNLESPLTNSNDKTPGKSSEAIKKKRDYLFRSSPYLASKLSFLKFTAFNLANNHIMDYSTGGLLDTFAALSSNNLYYFGAGYNYKEAHSPLLLTKKGAKIAFLGYSEIVPLYSLATQSNPGICSLDYEQIKKDINNAKKAGAEIIIINLHWGTELAKNPADYQKILTRRIINSGADVIIGHHSHVIQPVEVYKGKTIAYSLGNFIFWAGSIESRKTQILKIKFKKNKEWLQEYKLIPVYIKEGLPEILK